MALIEKSLIGFLFSLTPWTPYALWRERQGRSVATRVHPRSLHFKVFRRFPFNNFLFAIQCVRFSFFFLSFLFFSLFPSLQAKRLLLLYALPLGSLSYPILFSFLYGPESLAIPLGTWEKRSAAKSSQIGNQKKRNKQKSWELKRLDAWTVTPVHGLLVRNDHKLLWNCGITLVLFPWNGLTLRILRKIWVIPCKNIKKHNWIYSSRTTSMKKAWLTNLLRSVCNRMETCQLPHQRKRGTNRGTSEIRGPLFIRSRSATDRKRIAIWLCNDVLLITSTGEKYFRNST